MAKKDSVHKKLDKVRPPRVQLTYDVEVGDAIEQKEIPFVVGVLGDFTGTVSFAENLVNTTPQLIDAAVALVDTDSANFDGGRLDLFYVQGGGALVRDMASFATASFPAAGRTATGSGFAEVTTQFSVRIKSPSKSLNMPPMPPRAERRLTGSNPR